jgi:hypothetical protein
LIVLTQYNLAAKNMGNGDAGTKSPARRQDFIVTNDQSWRRRDGRDDFDFVAGR